MTSFYQSLTVNTEVSHVVYVRAEGAYLRNFSEIKKRVCHKSVTHPFLFFSFSQIRNL